MSEASFTAAAPGRSVESSLTLVLRAPRTYRDAEPIWVFLPGGNVTPIRMVIACGPDAWALSEPFLFTEPRTSEDTMRRFLSLSDASIVWHLHPLAIPRAAEQRLLGIVSAIREAFEELLR